jgi:hypothetical protein
MNNCSLGCIYSKQLFEIHMSSSYTTEFISYLLLNLPIHSNNNDLESNTGSCLRDVKCSNLKYNNPIATMDRHVKNGSTETGPDNLQTFW